LVEVIQVEAAVNAPEHVIGGDVLVETNHKTVEQASPDIPPRRISRIY
jgi:hypothetical protein